MRVVVLQRVERHVHVAERIILGEQAESPGQTLSSRPCSTKSLSTPLSELLVPYRVERLLDDAALLLHARAHDHVRVKLAVQVGRLEPGPRLEQHLELAGLAEALPVDGGVREARLLRRLRASTRPWTSAAGGSLGGGGAGTSGVVDAYGGLVAAVERTEEGGESGCLGARWAAAECGVVVPRHDKLQAALRGRAACTLSSPRR